jgi:hypothetical protein
LKELYLGSPNLFGTAHNNPDPENFRLLKIDVDLFDKQRHDSFVNAATDS